MTRRYRDPAELPDVLRRVAHALRAGDRLLALIELDALRDHEADNRAAVCVCIKGKGECPRPAACDWYLTDGHRKPWSTISRDRSPAGR